MKVAAFPRQEAVSLLAGKLMENRRSASSLVLTIPLAVWGWVVKK
jgi:hypothetical protein